MTNDCEKIKNSFENSFIYQSRERLNVESGIIKMLDNHF